MPRVAVHFDQWDKLVLCFHLLPSETFIKVLNSLIVAKDLQKSIDCYETIRQAIEQTTCVTNHVKKSVDIPLMVLDIVVQYEIDPSDIPEVRWLGVVEVNR